MRDYELYHAARKQHKYIKKIGNRYFYTQQEIKAYLEGKKPKDLTIEREDYGDDKDLHLDFNKQKGQYTYTDSEGKKHTQDYTMSDKIGVRVNKKNKSVELYNTTNDKYYKNDEKLIRKAKGRVVTEYAEDGVSRKIDLSKDKRNMKEEEARWKAFRENGGSDADTPEEYRKKQRKKAAKKVSKNAKKTLNSMKKQAAKGKKKIESIYKPKSTVTVVDRIDNKTGKHF